MAECGQAWRSPGAEEPRWVPGEESLQLWSLQCSGGLASIRGGVSFVSRPASNDESIPKLQILGSDIDKYHCNTTVPITAQKTLQPANIAQQSGP